MGAEREERSSLDLLAMLEFRDRLWSGVFLALIYCALLDAGTLSALIRVKYRVVVQSMFSVAEWLGWCCNDHSLKDPWREESGRRRATASSRPPSYVFLRQ
jgi:hypothetical protein